MIMIHSDNKGLVLPPKVAQNQIVIVPIFSKGDDIAGINSKAHEIAAGLKQSGLRATVDDRDTHNPGFKFAHWELRGTPIRIELGKRDIAKNEVRVCLRFNDEKFQVSQDDLSKAMAEQLDLIHKKMLEKAK